MVNYRQIKTLVKQELRRGIRSQYVIFSFVIFPLFMWGLQAGLQSVATSSLDTSGETFYVVNFDEGNMGQSIVDSLNVMLDDEGSPIYQAIMNTTITSTESEIYDLIKQGFSPMVIIPKNFTSVYENFNASINPQIPQVSLVSLPNDNFITLSVQTALNQILSQPPYTIVNIQKISSVSSEEISFEGEEEAGDNLSGIGFIAFLTIILAVMAPSAFVSASFAGERENRTLEALLALPMNRMSVMGSKLIAGLVLTVVFAIMNIFGILLFNQIVDESATLPVTANQLLAISLVLILTSFVALGIGIAIASLAKDQKTATTAYQMIMLFPTMLIGFATLINGVPEGSDPLYIVPWTHSIAVLMKGLYPQTFASSTLTGSIAFDIVLHLGYLVLFVLVFLYIGSKLFERENILN